MVAQSMGMFMGWLQFHEIDDIDNPDFDLRYVGTKEIDGGECFKGRAIPAANHDHVGFPALVITGPTPKFLIRRRNV